MLLLVAIVACRVKTPEDNNERTEGIADCVPVDEIPYDGVDQDCDGADVVDVDGDGFTGRDDCDDEDAAVYADADEIPYDGVDQDCDGADLVDLDGDGHVAEQAGGDDCDDEDATVYAGADEIPYDGVDQDCNGADLVDVDGDGYIAAEAGGDDCDDGDPNVYPGARDIGEDGVDNDCDGYTDEVDVCADGSGEVETIQQGIDAAPDGGTVILCPGIYAENVIVQGRVLSIVGGGSHPDDVEWGGAEADWTLYMEESEAAVEWMAMTGEGGFVIAGGERSNISVSYVSFPGPTYISVTSEDEASVEISMSAFYDECGMGGSSVDDGGFTLTRSALWNGVWIGLRGSDPDWGYVRRDLEISNSLFVGGEVWIEQYFADERASMTVSNNTFVDTVTLVRHHCGASSPYTAGATCFNPVVTRNVFYGMVGYTNGWSGDPPTALYLLSWNGITGTVDPSVEDELLVQAAPVFEDNVLWDLSVSSLLLATFVPYCCCDEYSCESGWNDTGYSAAMAAASIDGDPLFVDGPEGSYALDGASPARDVDASELDSDGSYADAGAFGGPDGDWWREYPWPLP